MITFDYDPVYRKGVLLCDDEFTFRKIRNHFSEKIEGAIYLKRFNKNAPSRNYAISDNGKFDFGLYNEIRKFLVDNQITDVRFSDTFAKRLNCGFEVVKVSDALSHDLRDYQTESVEKALQIGCGTIVLPTGAGKSYVQATLLESYKTNSQKDDFRCIIVVPGLSLVNQLTGDFKDYGVSFTYSGWTGGTEPDTSVNVIIVNSENLCSQFGNFKWLIDIDLVLVDECHKINSTAKTSKIVNKIKTPNKFGFTGTLPPKNIDKWKVIGTFGPVIYYKKSKELRDQNYLSDVSVRMIKIIHPKKKRDYLTELEYIQTLPERNNLIKDLVKKLNKNVLILVNRLEYGNTLLEILQIEGRETFFISGEMEVSDRSDITSKMEQQDDIVCVSMDSIFSTGINVKNLHYVMFVGGGKSFIRTVQSIGRGLRLHETKPKMVLFDIFDNLKYSEEHSEHRKRFYDEEKIEWKEAQIVL